MVAAALMMITSVHTATVDPDALYRRIRDDYFDAKTGFYREYWSPNAVDSQVAFNWSVGVALSAHNAMARYDRKYVADLRAYLKTVPKYWNPAGPVAGFDVLPGPSFLNDRYYDDNMWMALALVESYEITHEKQWLDLAKKALTFSLSGMDGRLGGGILWRERDKASKNTCSVAPAIEACLAVYRHTKDPKLVETSKTLYSWLKKNLMDPTDMLMWDNLSLSGKLDKTKWSYNSALMIKSAKSLGSVTGSAEYLEDASKMEGSAVAHWIDSNGVVADEYQFAHLLVESLSPGAVRPGLLESSLAASMSEAGRFGKRWGVKPAADAKLQLIHQVSVLRIVAQFRSRVPGTLF